MSTSVGICAGAALSSCEMEAVGELRQLLEEIVNRNTTGSLVSTGSSKNLRDARSSIASRSRRKLIYSLICLHITLAFKIIHRRSADRTPNCLVLIKHREFNDHPVEVVASWLLPRCSGGWQILRSEQALCSAISAALCARVRP